MAANTSLGSLTPRNFGFEQARHLLNRAGFGGTPRQVAALEQMGFEQAVNFLVDYESIATSALPEIAVDADIFPVLTHEQRLDFNQRRKEIGADDDEARKRLEGERRMFQMKANQADRKQITELRHWWLSRMITTPRPLQEKLTLFWHGHFASSFRSVRDSYLLYKQNDLFRQHANGNFAVLAHGVVRDPAMIVFLNNDRNNRRRPNENLARELMELFMLGEGHYTEQDIRQGARALTGYTYRDNEFHFNQRQHDPKIKLVFGKRGLFTGDDFVDLCLASDDCAAFICWKLYRFFVDDSPGDYAPGVNVLISRMAKRLRADDYQLKGVLKMLFRSQHFYDPSVIGAMIKSPAQLVVGSLRMFNAPVRDLGFLFNAMDLMGQRLFDPPTVAGWDGGRAWINTATLFARQNVTTYLLTGRSHRHNVRRLEQAGYDPMFLLEDLPNRTPADVADYLLDFVLVSPPSSQRRDQLLDFFKKHENKIAADTVLGALLLITAMPEYQLG